MKLRVENATMHRFFFIYDLIHYTFITIQKK